MAAKVRSIVGDQNSAELQAMFRSWNSFLLILQNIAAEQAAGTTTATQAAAALRDALANGVDSSAAPHVGTGRLVYGIKQSPNPPQRSAEVVTKLETMTTADKF